MNVRPLVALLALAPVIAVFACGNEPPAPPPAAPEAPRVDAAPATTTTSPPALAAAAPSIFDASPPPASKVEGALLPSGDYEITTEVKKDTCSKGDAGAATPDPVTLFVQMKVWRDKSGHERVTGNFPLPLPRAKGFGTARSDIVLSPTSDDASARATLSGMGSQCPQYETSTSYKVLEQTSNSVKVEYTRDYGDASKCPPKAQPPSKCALDYVYTFKLVNKVCDPRCGVTFAKGSDGGLGPKCQCGDGGTP